SQKTEGLMAEITALGGDNVDGRGSAPHTVVVRPGSSHSIQEAIDRVADGGTVILSAGVYQQTITISGKHLRILGAGATGAQRTQIVGEWRGGVVPADGATGLINLVNGASLDIRGITLRGGDNGIVAYDRAGPPAALHVQDMVFAGMGRGILVRSSFEVTVKQVHMFAMGGYGVSYTAEGDGSLVIQDVIISQSAAYGVGVFNFGTPAPPSNFPCTGPHIDISGLYVTGAKAGGLVVYGSAKPVCVANSTFFGNGYAAIRLMYAGYVEIKNCVVSYTAPRN